MTTYEIHASRLDRIHRLLAEDLAADDPRFHAALDAAAWTADCDPAPRGVIITAGDDEVPTGAVVLYDGGDPDAPGATVVCVPAAAADDDSDDGWPPNLYPARNADGWHVHDTEGGTWWPTAEAEVEIASAADPEGAAVAMCQSSPMRGVWHA